MLALKPASWLGTALFPFTETDFYAVCLTDKENKA